MNAAKGSPVLAEVRLTQDDAGEVLTLQRAAYASEAQIYHDPFLPALTQTLAEVQSELAGPALGLRHGARLVGAVRWIVEDAVAKIGRLTVVPDLQGHGIGTRLLRAAEVISGVGSFELFTGHRSAANIRLYEREGYHVTRREPLHKGVDLIFMSKSRPR